MIIDSVCMCVRMCTCVVAQLMNVLVEGGYRDLPYLSVMHNATRGTRRYPSCFATSEVANKTAML